jgi:hypothetical protein
MKTTKRRKVWVNEYVGGNLATCAHKSRVSATAQIGSDGKAVPFVEHRSGDVVLSRSQVDDVVTEAAQALLAEGWDAEDGDQVAKALAAALLRRRRFSKR